MKMIKDFMPLLVVGLCALVLLSDKAQTFLKELFASRDQVEDEKDYANTTLSKTEAQGIANKMYQAMSGVGTDEDNLMEAFAKIKNEDDFNFVYNLFGKRQYSKFWGNDGDPASSDKLDLLEWLANDLSNDPSIKRTLSKSHPYIII